MGSMVMPIVLRRQLHSPLMGYRLPLAPTMEVLKYGRCRRRPTNLQVRYSN